MAWAHEGTRHERGYGYQWQKLRERIMVRDMWLCQTCKRTGRVTPATEVDHIIGKAVGGTDDRDNLEAICTPCHKAKTKAESGPRRRSRKPAYDASGWPVWGEQPKPQYSIPDMVQPSGVPVILVCGPPASGKTTYVMDRAGPLDLVIDLDAYKVRAGGRSWDTRADIWRKAYAMRDAAIRSLASRTAGQAYLIVGAPTQAERNQWRETLGDLTAVVIDTPEDECIRRIKADPARAHAANDLIEAVETWWMHN